MFKLFWKGKMKRFVIFSRKLWINRLLIFQGTGPKIDKSISIHSDTFDLINNVEDIIVFL